VVLSPHGHQNPRAYSLGIWACLHFWPVLSCQWFFTMGSGIGETLLLATSILYVRAICSPFWVVMGPCQNFWLGLGRIRSVNSGSGKFPPKLPNFTSGSKKSRLVGSEPGWPLICCRSEVCLGRVTGMTRLVVLLSFVAIQLSYLLIRKFNFYWNMFEGPLVILLPWPSGQRHLTEI